MARSCEPPAEECPVNASGISVTKEPTNNSGVDDQRSTGRLANITVAASNAVHRHAVAMLIRLASDQIVAGLRWAVSGCPETSEMVSGISSTAHTAHTPAATVPIRTAR